MPELTEHVTLSRREHDSLSSQHKRNKASDRSKFGAASGKDSTKSSSACDVPRPSSASRFRRMVERCRSEDASDDDGDLTPT